MRIFFDTEFIENGVTIDLLSIGLVREDGHYYYMEIAETNRERACPWVRENVLPHLTGPIASKYNIANDIKDFAGENPEFWADHAAYDWVALCQLYGRMVDLPPGWPMFVRDVACLPNRKKIIVPQQGTQHNALEDARHCMAIYNACMKDPRS